MDLGVACRPCAPLGGLVTAVEESARAAEDLGLASWWVSGDRDAAGDGSWDPFLVLQAAARSTDRIRLATAGDVLAVRSPGVRAKQVASLDWFAGGRLDYALDIADPPGCLDDPFGEQGPGPDPDPLATTLEHLEVMSALWTQDRAGHRGSRIEFDGAIAKPKPRGGVLPPVHVRLTDSTRMAAYVAGGGRVDGWLAWLTEPGELAERAAELTVEVHGRRPRLTWFVRADDLGPAQQRAGDLGVGVDEIVAVLDHLPTRDDLARLVGVAA